MVKEDRVLMTVAGLTGGRNNMTRPPCLFAGDGLMNLSKLRGTA